MIGLWEAGELPRTTHQEFGDRITLDDSARLTSHATHIAGTLTAVGVNPALKGMAPAANIIAYQSAGSNSEMTALAAARPGVPGTIYVSNHSYGFLKGWKFNGSWRFFGTFVNDGDPSTDYSINFGRYDNNAAAWDGIAWNAPYHAIFKTAGNDRSDFHPPTNTIWRLNNIFFPTYSYNPATYPIADFEYLVDGTVEGFGTIGQRGSCKNIFTIGSVTDAVSRRGLRDIGVASLSGFSCAGPTDDGRIKPDLVANGENLTSSSSKSDLDTSVKRGTSMSSPNACGSALLLQDYYDDHFPGEAMLTSMLKGVMIHTADGLGNPGPDYRFGWSLLNTESAAALIKDHADSPSTHRMIENQLTATIASRSDPVVSNGIDPIRVTLSWTDPPGTNITAHDSRTSVLVNDLNLKLTSPDGATRYLPYIMPWVGVWTDNLLDDDATTGVNTIDNSEQVYLATPPAAGTYTITIDHAGSLRMGPQNYALVVSGGSVTASSAFSGGGWSAEALVDGLSRDSRILPIREWLRGLDWRNRLEHELATLQLTLDLKSSRQANLLRWGSIAALLLLLALAIILWRNHHVRRTQLQSIREQIASDLHDEIGSNLGSIALLSEGLVRRSKLSERETSLLDDIAQVARESSQTIRDIVWVLGKHTGREEDIILRMRQTSARMLEGIDYTFKVPAQDPTTRFPLKAKRHLLLFFKEALHNVIKHARATRVEIRVAGSDGSFNVIVHDNGIGIDPAAAEENPSHLEKLRARARRVPGDFDITTAPGEGTQLRLHVSLS